MGDLGFVLEYPQVELQLACGELGGLDPPVRNVLPSADQLSLVPLFACHRVVRLYGIEHDHLVLQHLKEAFGYGSVVQFDDLLLVDDLADLVPKQWNTARAARKHKPVDVLMPPADILKGLDHLADLALYHPVPELLVHHPPELAAVWQLGQAHMALPVLPRKHPQLDYLALLIELAHVLGVLADIHFLLRFDSRVQVLGQKLGQVVSAYIHKSSLKHLHDVLLAGLQFVDGDAGATAAELQHAYFCGLGQLDRRVVGACQQVIRVHQDRVLYACNIADLLEPKPVPMAHPASDCHVHASCPQHFLHVLPASRLRQPVRQQAPHVKCQQGLHVDAPALGPLPHLHTDASPLTLHEIVFVVLAVAAERLLLVTQAQQHQQIVQGRLGERIKGYGGPRVQNQGGGAPHPVALRRN